MKISELTLQEQEHVLKKIEELAKHDGWDILKQIMSTERETFFRKMSEPGATIVPEVIHYNRGIIEGTYRMSELPEKLAAQLKASINIATAQLNAAVLPPTTTP